VGKTDISFNIKYLKMKKLLVISGFVAFILFADYLLMAVIGCFANLCGASDKFFCGPFCSLGIALLTISLILPAIPWVFRQLKMHH